MKVRLKYEDCVKLWRMYLERDRTIREIATQFGCSTSHAKNVVNIFKAVSTQSMSPEDMKLYIANRKVTGFAGAHFNRGEFVCNIYRFLPSQKDYQSAKASETKLESAFKLDSVIDTSKSATTNNKNTESVPVSHDDIVNLIQCIEDHNKLLRQIYNL